MITMAHFSYFLTLSRMHLTFTWYLVMTSFWITCLGMPLSLRHNDRNILLIGLDGLRHDIFQLANMTNLREIIREGVKAKRVRPASPPHSWPTQHTLVTGLHPESHGIVSNEFWDPEYNRLFSYTSRPDFRLNFWRKEGVEPIWLTNERLGGRSAVYSWCGVEAYSHPSYFAARHFEGWRPLYSLRDRVDETIRYFKDNLNQIIFNLRSSLPPSFSALYWDHPDWCGHKYGPDSQEMVYTMERTDTEAFGYLLRELKRHDLFDKLNIIIVADHGMKRANGVQVLGLNTYLDWNSYFLSDTWAFASLWPVEGKEDEILKNLSRAEPYLMAYKKKDAPFDLYYGKSTRNAPIIVVPRDGNYFVDYNPGTVNNPGTHKFPAHDPDMHTIFLARGPAFKRGVIVEPFDSVDLYPLMAQILGIEPNPNNGSLDLARQVLQEKFLDASAGEINAAIAYVRPDISRTYENKIYGRFQFTSTNTSKGVKTTQVHVELHGLQEYRKYRMAVYTYGHMHHFGCFGVGVPFKFFDLPQEDGSLQTTWVGAKDKILTKTFYQSDIRLNGAFSVIGRMVVVEDITGGDKSTACGSISPAAP